MAAGKAAVNVATEGEVLSLQNAAQPQAVAVVRRLPGIESFGTASEFAVGKNDTQVAVERQSAAHFGDESGAARRTRVFMQAEKTRHDAKQAFEIVDLFGELEGARMGDAPRRGGQFRFAVEPGLIVVPRDQAKGRRQSKRREQQEARAQRRQKGTGTRAGRGLARLTHAALPPRRCRHGVSTRALT